MQSLTLEQIGNHLGISKQAVAKVLSKLQIDWREKTLDEVRLAYCARLREVAAGQASIDGEYDPGAMHVHITNLPSALSLMKR